MEWVATKVSDYKDKLKGLVTGDQIEKKCIEVQYNDTQFTQWVDQLVPQDDKYAGLKEYEWNDTITK